MDASLIHSVVTVVLFVTFVGIWVWAWSAKRKRAFEEAAMLPLIDDEPVNTNKSASGEGSRHE
jgi:cytochrome c oxidase cbb3-type subunit 4